MSFLPASGLYLALKVVFNHYAHALEMAWTAGTHVSSTPVWTILFILLIDVALYMMALLWLSALQSKPPENEHRALFSASVHGDTQHGYTGHWPLLRAVTLTKRFSTLTSSNICARNVKDDVTILKNITATLYRGEIVCLMGKNGAGSSTLIRILAGVDPLYEGLLQREEAGAGRFSIVPRRDMGYCPQQIILFDSLTVLEHILFVQGLLRNKVDLGRGTTVGKLAAKTELKLLLTRLGLWTIRKQSIDKLSCGMKRRLQLALALLGDPPLLLLDQPTVHCDKDSIDIIRAEILRRGGESGILVSSHDSDDLELYGGKLWYLKNNQLEFNGFLNTTYSATNNDTTTAIDKTPKTCLTVFDSVSTQIVTKWLGNSDCMTWRAIPATVAQIDAMSSISAGGGNDDTAGSIHSTRSGHNRERIAPLIRAEATWEVEDSRIGALRGAIEELENLNINPSGGNINSADEHVPCVGSTFILQPPYASLLTQLSGEEPAKDIDIDSEMLAAAESQADSDHQYLGSPKDESVKPRTTQQILAVYRLRMGLFNSSLFDRLLLHVVFPLIIVASIALQCRTMSRPTITISGSTLGGVGDVLATDCRGGNKHVISDMTSDIVWQGTKRKSAREGYCSTELVKHLSEQYYTHTTDHKLAFLLHDIDLDLFDVTVSIPIESAHTKDDMESAISFICNQLIIIDDDDDDPNNDKLDGLELNDDPVSSSFSSGESRFKRIKQIFCMAGVTVDVCNTTIPDKYLITGPTNDRMPSSSYLKQIKYWKDRAKLKTALLRTRFTRSSDVAVLVNESYHHMAVLALKDYIPLLLQDAESNILSYHPLSYSLDVTPITLDEHSEGSNIRRAYTGISTIILFVTILPVLFVGGTIIIKKSKLYLFIRLSGITYSTYWISNWIFDMSTLIFSMIVITIGIVIEHYSVASYMFPSINTLLKFHQGSVLYSCAITASNYLITLRCENVLFAQIMVAIMSVISAMMALVLEMASIRKIAILKSIERIWLWLSPTFAYSTFALGKKYVNFITYIK